MIATIFAIPVPFRDSTVRQLAGSPCCPLSIQNRSVPSGIVRSNRALAININWWGVAVLSLRGADGWSPAHEVSRGNVAEMISLALSWPEDEQSRLFLTIEQPSRRLSWTKIQELATRPDFPVFI